MRSLPISLALVLLAAVALVATPRQTGPMPIDEIRPGMVGVGRTVYAGHDLEDFRVTVLGVMRNVVGPRRDLILARLEGGPLANTGVIQGMSGSPVYIDGRLIGAVSYSLGSFPKEPIAGITPIAEMIADIESRGTRSASADFGLTWPATPTQVFDALAHIARRAAAPLGQDAARAGLLGPRSLADLAPELRPIGAAITMSGFEPRIAGHLASALQAPVQQSPERPAAPVSAAAPLRPGDPVGMSLVRGDFEMGATGTVTHIDGSRVYAFGHPFLNLGPTHLPMTEANVVTVLPSLDSSMKLASLGRVIGTITQDRATVVGGTLGAGPRELAVRLRLGSDGGPTHDFEFHVLNDPSLTPLFTYAALLNALTAYERQMGAMSLAIRGTVSFGDDATIEIDDVFSGETAVSTAAAMIAAPLGILMPNTFKAVTADALTVDVQTAEAERYATIERAWLDTVHPVAGASYRVHVQLRDYRGDTRTVDLPVTMPVRADGPLTLLVADAPTLTRLEQQELRPTQPANWEELVTRTNAVRRGNRVYVRLLAGDAGTVLGHETLPALPASVQSALQSDNTTARTSVSRHIVGASEHRMDRLVRGSRELTITLDPAR